MTKPKFNFQSALISEDKNSDVECVREQCTIEQQDEADLQDRKEIFNDDKGKWDEIEQNLLKMQNQIDDLISHKPPVPVIDLSIVELYRAQISVCMAYENYRKAKTEFVTGFEAYERLKNNCHLDIADSEYEQMKAEYEKVRGNGNS